MSKPRAGEASHWPDQPGLVVAGDWVAAWQAGADCHAALLWYTSDPFLHHVIGWLEARPRRLSTLYCSKNLPTTNLDHGHLELSKAPHACDQPRGRELAFHSSSPTIDAVADVGTE